MDNRFLAVTEKNIIILKCKRFKDLKQKFSVCSEIDVDQFLMNLLLFFIEVNYHYLVLLNNCTWQLFFFLKLHQITSIEYVDIA